ncbi:unnamed protein product [Chrysoparadoxa australica]
MESAKPEQRGVLLRAIALAWLAVSGEAFNVASSIRAHRSWTPGAGPGSFASARPTPSSALTMSASRQNTPIQTLAALMGAASVAIATMSPALALDSPPQAAPQQTAQVATIGEVSEVRYSDFVKEVLGDKIEKVSFSSDGQRLVAVDTDGNRQRLDALPNDPELLTILTKHKVDVTVLPAQADKARGGSLIGSLLFPAILFGGLLFLTRRGQGEEGEDGGSGPMGGMGGGNPMDFAKSQSKIQLNPDTGTKFADVAGCDGAKFELEEVVDFLKAPDRYTDLGAQIPRGVVLEGPPGTGKTLLARAVAGEAGVPFIAISGSEFVEMFVGVGASRVRDLFGKAKENAPCIIFIDEIDAVGRQRGAGMAGGNDEREQTLNQILTEMDGFEGNPGIIVIAATNRADVLDSALLRPGRFDRRVNVGLPDFTGRIAILKVHSRGKPLAPDVDLEAVARRTPGFSGAQIQNLLNEAAIRCARREDETITWEDVDGALDRLLVGVEKKGGTSSPMMQEIVAYHEAGHAIVGALMPDYDMVQKVTIIPRSNGAGGLTFFSPDEGRLESGLYSRQYLEAQLAVALAGGRLAEELAFGEDAVTTGASNDLQQVGNIAKRMVTQWGMSEGVGEMVVGDPEDQSPFVGRQMGGSGTIFGPSISSTVENEVERVVTNAYATGKKILKENWGLMETLAQTLIEQESVSAEELSKMIVESKDVVMAPYGVYGDEVPTEVLPFKQEPTLETLRTM